MKNNLMHFMQQHTKLFSEARQHCIHTIMQRHMCTHTLNFKQ